MLFNLLEQLEHCHAQGVGDDFQGIERRVGLTTLQAAEVGLVEATFFPENSLAHASGLAQGAHT